MIIKTQPEHAAPGLLQNPIYLLLFTGVLLGFHFPLGKLAGNAGISPVMWAMIVSLGVLIMLFPFLVLKKQLKLPRGQVLRYIVISGVISFVLPNLLLFSVIPHVGAGYTGLMFALSPVFTVIFSVLLRMKSPGKAEMIGIGIGLIGAIIVSITRVSAQESPPVFWIIAVVFIPIMLAIGNVYRTIDWPKKATPDGLAFWGHGVSVLIYVLILWRMEEGLHWDELTLAPYATMAQMVIAGMTYSVLFRLQKKGGPVLLSQIGYVAAAVSLIIATVLLEEEYSLMTWLGAFIIAVGIFITISAQIKMRSRKVAYS